MNKEIRLFSAITIAVIFFSVSVMLPKLIFRSGPRSVLITQGIQLSLSLIAIAVFGQGRSADYGFRWPHNLVNKSLIISVGLAVAAGELSTLSLILLGTSGHPLINSLSVPKIILLVWIFSSIVEEIFTLGFLQGHRGSFEETKVFGPISKAAFISVLFFSLMHTVLLISGAQIMTTLIIVLFTFTLGLLAGH